jgi:hypothetical protein
MPDVVEPGIALLSSNLRIGPRAPPELRTFTREQEGVDMTWTRGAVTTGIACVMAIGAAASLFAGQKEAGQKDKEQKDDRRPRLVLKAQPSVAISPARVVLTAELQGGANDFQDYYCASVEWEWGDDTRSESNIDCEPFEEGKSEIKRRFTVEHVFQRSGAYKISVRLKQRTRQVAMATTNVQIRPGAHEF